MLIPLLIALLVTPQTSIQTTISGRITDDSGQPLAAHVVELQSRYGTALSPNLFATSDASGAYLLSGVEPGTWRIRISKQAGVAHFNLLTDAIDIDDQSRTINFEIPKAPTEPPNIQPGIGYGPVPPSEVASAPNVAGYFMDVQTQEPVRKASIHFYTLDDGDLTDPAYSATSNEVGFFELEQFEAGSYQVGITAEGYQEPAYPIIKLEGASRIFVHLLDDKTDLRTWFGRRPARARAWWGDGTPVHVLLSPAVQTPWGVLNGRLAYEWGHSPNAMVELMSPDGHPLHRFLHVLVDADGSFTIHTIPPAQYLLRVTIDNRAVDIPNVTISAGPNELNVAL